MFYAPLFEQEVVGRPMLERMADEIFKEKDPSAIMYSSRIQQVEKIGNEYIYSIYMPFIEKKEVQLNQKGDELIIRVGNVKRNVTMPRTLVNLSITSAKFEEETLKIRFGGNGHE